MNLRTTILLLSCAALLVTGCSGGGSDSSSSGPGSGEAQPTPIPSYDFAAVDARFQQFLDDNARFDGISVILVDKIQGVIHEAAFGDHNLDTIVLLASASKMPASSLLMALNDDASLAYDVEATIDNYLPWDGVYGDRTTEQLLSNTSGIPGLDSIDNYGLHLCQFTTIMPLESCARIIYSTELSGTRAAGSLFDYGGSQWHLSGAVAEQVTNSTWRQAWDKYLAGPCELEVFQFGNPLPDIGAWNGHPDSLIGLDNPSVEGGGISNLQDYGKILLMHLRDGMCGDHRVMAADSPAYMRRDRGGEFDEPYGMGWRIDIPKDGSEPYLFTDFGAFGSISWLDTRRMIGGYVAIDDYYSLDAGAVRDLVKKDVIPLIEQIVDEGRATAEP